MSKRKKLFLLGDAIFLILLTSIDQIAKYYAVIALKNKPAITVIPGILEFNYLENKGAAFGMLQDQKVLFVFVALIILSIIIYIVWKAPDDKKYNIIHILLSMIAAGALGNMIDRLRLNYVVDFINLVFINFPIFNVADIYVTIAAFLLGIQFLFVLQEEDLNFLSFKTKKYREIK